MSALTSRGARLRRSLRDSGLGLLVAGLGLTLVFLGGAFGIFFGIPLAAGGGLALGIGLYGLVRYGVVPGRRVVCPRCGSTQRHLRELRYVSCVQCSLPLLFVGAGPPRHTRCRRCSAAFGVWGGDGDEVACPDCGRLHQLSGGEVFELPEVERLPGLEDFVPGGALFGEALELRRLVRSPAGEVIFAAQLVRMLGEGALAVVWGELAARTRALDEILRALQRAVNEGELDAAPDFWPEVVIQAARIFDGWSRYLELTGPLELRDAEVNVDYPVGLVIRKQHKLAELPGFGGSWSLEAAAMIETDRWLAPSIFTVEDHRPLRELARSLFPESVGADPGRLDRAEYDRLLERFSVDRLSAGKRARLARLLGLDPAEARAVADLSHAQNLSAGLALLRDGRAAFWGAGRPRFLDVEDITEAYFVKGALRLETTRGETLRLSRSAPRDERAILFLLRHPPDPDDVGGGQDGENR